MTITMINSSANKNIGYIKTISLIIAFVFLFENTGHSFLYASQNKTNLRIPLASSIGKDKERLKRILLLAGKSVSPVRPADEYRFNVAAIAEPVSIWQPWTAILLMGVLGTQRPVQKMMLTASSSVVQQARREIYHENINESSYEVHVDYELDGPGVLAVYVYPQKENYYYIVTSRSILKVSKEDREIAQNIVLLEENGKVFVDSQLMPTVISELFSLRVVQHATQDFKALWQACRDYIPMIAGVDLINVTIWEKTREGILVRNRDQESIGGVADRIGRIARNLDNVPDRELPKFEALSHYKENLFKRGKAQILNIEIDSTMPVGEIRIQPSGNPNDRVIIIHSLDIFRDITDEQLMGYILLAFCAESGDVLRDTVYLASSGRETSLTAKDINIKMALMAITIKGREFFRLVKEIMTSIKKLPNTEVLVEILPATRTVTAREKEGAEEQRREATYQQYLIQQEQHRQVLKTRLTAKYSFVIGAFIFQIYEEIEKSSRPLVAVEFINAFLNADINTDSRTKEIVLLIRNICMKKYMNENDIVQLFKILELCDNSETRNKLLQHCIEIKTELRVLFEQINSFPANIDSKILEVIISGNYQLLIITKMVLEQFPVSDRQINIQLIIRACRIVIEMQVDLNDSFLPILKNCVNSNARIAFLTVFCELPVESRKLFLHKIIMLLGKVAISEEIIRNIERNLIIYQGLKEVSAEFMDLRSGFHRRYHTITGNLWKGEGRPFADLAPEDAFIFQNLVNDFTATYQRGANSLDNAEASAALAKCKRIVSELALVADRINRAISAFEEEKAMEINELTSRLDRLNQRLALDPALTSIRREYGISGVYLPLHELASIANREELISRYAYFSQRLSQYEEYYSTYFKRLYERFEQVLRIIAQMQQIKNLFGISPELTGRTFNGYLTAENSLLSMDIAYPNFESGRYRTSAELEARLARFESFTELEKEVIISYQNLRTKISGLQFRHKSAVSLVDSLMGIAQYALMQFYNEENIENIYEDSLSLRKFFDLCAEILVRIKKLETDFPYVIGHPQYTSVVIGMLEKNMNLKVLVTRAGEILQIFNHIITPKKDTEMHKPAALSYTPFRMLGLSEDANSDGIKSAYRRLAMLFHPDRWAEHQQETGVKNKKEAEELFRALQWAYELLQDEDFLRNYKANSSNTKDIIIRMIEETKISTRLVQIVNQLLSRKPDFFKSMSATRDQI